MRGRGGAGFPTSVKWQGVYESAASRKFICCNAAEGEPGTFKDRYLMRHNPYQTLEGLMVGVEVVGAESAYFCLKQAFRRESELVHRALDEMRTLSPLADRIEIVEGPDEYLFGEEKAMLEVVEGGLPLPRVFPPRIHGLFGGSYGGPTDEENNPTVVNNVETLAHVTHILRNGAAWFRELGTEDTPGTMVFSVSGDVRTPVVREAPLGTTLRELIFDVAGGPHPGRSVKAVFPGVANSVITEPQLDAPLGFDSMKVAGSALGSGGFIVYDDSACMVKALELFSRFLYVESCNQCPPCKIGSRGISERLESLLSGEGRPGDIDAMWDATTWVENNRRCYLPTSEALVTTSVLSAFRNEFVDHINGVCRRRHDMLLSKMTDYVESEGFTYDRQYGRKEPDWSYRNS